MRLQKIIFLSMTMLLTLMTFTIGGSYILYTIRNNREQQKDLGKTRAMVLLREVEKLVLWDDQVELKQLLVNEVRGSDLLDYAFVTVNGAPYVSTFSRGIPMALLQQPVGSRQPAVWEFRDTEGRVRYDVRTGERQSETVLHLGLKRGAIDRQIHGLIAAIVVITIATTVAGVLLAFVLARRSTREIHVLVEALKQFFERAAIRLSFDAIRSGGEDRDDAIFDRGKADVFLIREEQTSGGFDEDLGALRLLLLEHADQRFQPLGGVTGRFDLRACFLDRLRDPLLVERLQQVVDSVHFKRFDGILIEGRGENYFR